MFDFLSRLFDPTGFRPRFGGKGWTRELIWLHTASDALIWLAYLLLPLVLIWFVRRRKDVPFAHLFWLFGAFLLGCGTTHLMEVVVIYWPLYRLAGVVKLFTAFISLGTVAALVPAVPKALRLRGPEELEREVEARTAELARVNAELRASEQRSRAIFDLAPVGMAQVGVATGRFLRVNAAYCELVGYSAEELLGGMTFTDVTHPDDRQADYEGLRTLVRGDKSVNVIEKRYVRKDGRIVWARLSVSLERDAAGKPCRSIAVADNVTDLKQAEEEARKFQSIIENSFDAYAVLDREGKFVFANQTVFRKAGYSREELAALRVWDLDPATPPDKYDQIFAQIQRGPIPRFETTVRRKDGMSFPVEIGAIGIEVHGQRLVAVVARDLTGRKQSEAELAERAARLKEADRRKDEFLAMLAHELRNPLAPIRNAVQIMESSGPRQQDLRWASGVVERQVQHLGRLVDDLLDVSRISRGKIKLQKEPVDLSEVVARAVETSLPLIESKRHELSVVMPPDPVRVNGDGVRLAQVLGNLLNNAAKYTEEGGRIELLGRREGGDVVWRVRDTGLGIPADVLPHVFDLFQQVDRSLDRSQGGLGIGLTLVRELVALHGGTVEAQSGGPGLGSEFVVRLPALPDVGPRSPSAPHYNEANGRPAKRRILVVDDNRDAAESLALLLRLRRHDVHVAFDGPTALAAARTHAPEAVVLDIGLPGMDGYEVARQLRQEEGLERIRLIALTGYGREEDRRRSLAAGFDVHLIKPVDPWELMALLDCTASPA